VFPVACWLSCSVFWFTCLDGECDGSEMEVTRGVVVAMDLMVAATDLRWVWWRRLRRCGGGDCHRSEMGVMQGCGSEVLMWRCWIWRLRCAVDTVCDWCFMIRDSLTA
jgi:hypothetical protein